MTADFGLTQWIAVFLVAASALVWAGIVLARAGDRIAVRSGFGGLLIGMVLMAAATSLPEVVTDVSAAAGGAPDLAVGDLFGSNLANMAVLAVIDLIARRKVWPNVELGHARVASIAIVLTSLAVLGILTPRGIAVGWVGLDTIGIAAAYLLAVAWVRRARAHSTTTGPDLGELPVPTGWTDGAGREGSIRAAVLTFAGAAAVVLVTGPFVAVSGREIAHASGLGQTFVGVALLAVATSLPELVASVAAVRIGAFDLAVGNLFGSNAINMAILVVVDLAYTRGPLLAAVGPAETVAGVGAILLMAIALAAVVHREETRIMRLEPDAALVLLAYVGVLGAVAAASSG
jgi:cation:H+ antiporter